MILLESAFSLITPDPGLLIWSVIIFGILWLILGKVAFKPIVQSLKDRTASIAASLAEAEKAKKEMQELTAKNEDLLKGAREERASILREANEVKEKIIAEARTEAKTAAAKELELAKGEIEAQKNAVMVELKNASAQLAIEIAEKVLSKELADKSAQEKLVSDLISKASLN